jgi:hypothetical protein
MNAHTPAPSSTPADSVPVCIQLVLVLVEDVLHHKALLEEVLVAEGAAPPADRVRGWTHTHAHKQRSAQAMTAGC